MLLNLSNRGNRRIIATATVTGCTPQRYDWNFGNDAVDATLSTTSNSASSDLQRRRDEDGDRRPSVHRRPHDADERHS